MILKDKQVIITGATGGIGQELCINLAKEGACVLMISKSTDKLKELLTKMEGEGHDFIVYDFKNVDEFDELEKKIRDKCKNIDVLINAAGVGIYKTLEELDVCEWNDSILINTTIPFMLTKSLISLLKKSSESIVLNIGSGMGSIPTAGRSAYCASKFALRGLTLSLAEEYKENGVHFIHIALGSTLTDFGPMTLKEKEEENLQGKAYFTPDWVAKKFIETLKGQKYESDIELYPSEYTEKKWWPSGGSSK